MRLAKKIYSERIEKAIQKAVALHDGQIRIASEVNLPYVSHLFSVFLLLTEYTRDEDVLIAGILHDAIEDTDYSYKELQEDFGMRVCNIVRGVTEEKERNGKKLPWKERKLGYLANLKHDSEESMLICVADKIYNLNALVRDYNIHGERLWSLFDTGLEEKLWYHEEVIEILRGRIKNKKALNDLKSLYNGARTLLLTTQAENKKKEEERGWFEAVSLQLTFYLGKLGNGLKTLLSRVLSARIFGYGNRNTS